MKLKFDWIAELIISGYKFLKFIKPIRLQLINQFDSMSWIKIELINDCRMVWIQKLARNQKSTEVKLMKLKLAKLLIEVELIPHPEG